HFWGKSWLKNIIICQILKISLNVMLSDLLFGLFFFLGLLNNFVINIR
ncbi:MAG: hypothetical protein MRECE_30c001, partial [Mycoplasmataceae bacterium CE_OT135]